MPAPIPVAILGFSAFDRRALASYFLLSEQAWPRYERVLGADDATLLIADADEPSVVSLLYKLGRVGDALFIGAAPPGGAAAWMMRPIDQVQVLHQLDTLLAQRDSPDSSPLPLSLPMPLPLPRGPLRTVGTANLDDLPARRAEDSGSMPLQQTADQRAQQEARRRQRRLPVAPQLPARVLLVDDSEIALHFLRRQLEAYGLEIDMARHSDRALDLLTHHAYGLVFIDIDLGEHSRVDGLTLCHHIRQRLVHPGGRAPMVVMVSASHDPVDQVRGSLAGAEAFLGKPLDLAALDRLLDRQGFSRHLPASLAPQQPLPPGPRGPRGPR